MTDNDDGGSGGKEQVQLKMRVFYDCNLGQCCKIIENNFKQCFLREKLTRKVEQKVKIIWLIFKSFVTFDTDRLSICLYDSCHVTNRCLFIFCCFVF